MEYPELPWPPSVNHYWVRTKRGARRSDAAEAFLLECITRLRSVPGSARYVNGERLRLRIWAWPPDHRARDIDNILKGILDGLHHAGIYNDDNQVDVLIVNREPSVKGGRISFAVEKIERGV